MLVNVENLVIMCVFYVKDTGEEDINENYANGDISIRAYTMVMCHNGRCPRNL